MSQPTLILLAVACCLAAASEFRATSEHTTCSEHVMLQHASNLQRVTLQGKEESEPEEGEPEETGNCYGELSAVVADEGSGIGAPKVETQSVAECQRVCSEHGSCKSFTFCPVWNGCWMKDLSLSGGEATQGDGSCRTYYKTPCTTTTTTIAAAAAGAAAAAATGATPPPQATGSKIRVVSYNLYWWNAFDQNEWKSKHVLENIKVLNADTLGLQECDSPDLIATETGYSAASPFKGAQGVTTKPGVFEVESRGSRDIQATGKWGPRYVTWAQLKHIASGRKFWHFNTHWCVHECDRYKRLTGAKNMLSAIQEVAGDAPVVITGDFNADMNEPGPRHLMQNGFALAVTSWVDAVFYSEAHWQVHSTEKGDSAQSDHRPVIAELKLIQ